MGRLLSVCLQHNWPVQWLDELDSTNLEAHRRAVCEEYGPVWIAAKRQSAGRGRLGREWHSPEGNLAATALFPFDSDIKLAPLVCFVAGMAIIDASEELGVPSGELKLKWPNDVRYEGSKLSGILIETGAMRHDGLWMAVGIGVNISTAPNIDQNTTCLEDIVSGSPIAGETFLDALSQAFSRRLKVLITSGFDSLRAEWLAKSEGLNNLVTVRSGDRVVSGIMTGMDESGALVLQETSGAIRKVTAGDVEIVKSGSRS